jgi:hypothetical protein
MVWSCFWLRERGSLYSLPLKGTKNGDWCMKVLEEKLFPWMERLGAPSFIQDGFHATPV